MTEHSLENGAQQAIKESGHIFLETVKEFRNDDCEILAAAITFYTMFAIFPFIILVIFLSTYFGGENLLNFLLSFVDVYFPPELRNFFYYDIVHIFKESYSSVGLISILPLMWASRKLFWALETGINRAYNIEGQRSIMRNLVGGMLTVLTLVIILPFVISLYNTIKFLSPVAPPSVVTALFTLYLLPLFQLTLSNMLLYKITLLETKSMRHLFPGSFFAASMWLLTMSILNLYLKSASGHNKIYGSFTAIIIIMLFFYISATIILFGAELNDVIGCAKGRKC